MNEAKRTVITGKAVSVAGDDIDTDRIIPARYLKCVTFEGLRERAFEDDRAQLKERGETHPFDDPVFADAQILLVGKNFGCGSSREHAPQALMRWHRGIRAIVGESFAEIFFGNCLTLGIPCLTGEHQSMAKLMQANRAQPELQLRVDLEKMQVFFGDESVPVRMPDAPRAQLLQGRWDPTLELLECRDQITEKAKSLPYWNGWR